MVKGCVSLFFLIILFGGALLGMPSTGNRTKIELCPDNCCNLEMESTMSQRDAAVDLCRTMNCTVSAPNSMISTHLRRAYLFADSKPFPIFQSFFAVDIKAKAFSFNAEKSLFPNISQPKYIYNRSLLI